LMSPSSASTALPSLRLSLICAVKLRSVSVILRYMSLTSMFTPPMRSASFSFFASQRAAELLAPCSERANTEEPRARDSMKESACMDTNRSA